MSRRPDLDPMVRAWEPVNVDPCDWPQHTPAISKRDDAGRGDRFWRTFIAVQNERRQAREAREKGQAG